MTDAFGLSMLDTLKIAGWKSYLESEWYESNTTPGRTFSKEWAEIFNSCTSGGDDRISLPSSHEDPREAAPQSDVAGLVARTDRLQGTNCWAIKQ